MRGVQMRAGSWLLLLAALAACGGRAISDPDQAGVDPSRPIDEASAGGGGASPDAGGSAGATNATDAACAKYCDSQAQKVCAFEAYAECTPSCSKEMAYQTLDCQTHATAMLDCFVAAYQSSRDCNSAEQFARDQCALLITTYQACTRGGPPTSSPAPSPAPSRPPFPAGCSGTGSGNAMSCTMSMKCGSGSQAEIHCKQNTDGTSSCACARGGFFILNETVASACDNGIGNCPF